MWPTIPRLNLGISNDIPQFQIKLRWEFRIEIKGISVLSNKPADNFFFKRIFQRNFSNGSTMQVPERLDAIYCYYLPLLTAEKLNLNPLRFV